MRFRDVVPKRLQNLLHAGSERPFAKSTGLQSIPQQILHWRKNAGAQRLKLLDIPLWLVDFPSLYADAFPYMYPLPIPPRPSHYHTIPSIGSL